MTPCFAVEIVTPKKVRLYGLWLGSKRPKRVVIWVHGLGSSMFSKLYLAEHLIDRETAVLVFNNRGHDKVSRLMRAGEKKIGKTSLAGAAHEVFTDCADDIQGAVTFAKRQGVKTIFLAGHSTGCQKSTYWAYKNAGGRGVKGIILLAPMSDYAAAVVQHGKAKLARIASLARALVKRGKKHQLLPESIFAGADDAQRTLSLYSGEGAEEIFTYWDAQRNPIALKSVQTPLLVLLAEKDEYADRPAKNIAEWFGRHLRQTGRVKIIPKVTHGFKGGEKEVAREMRIFVKAATR